MQLFLCSFSVVSLGVLYSVSQPMKSYAQYVFNIYCDYTTLYLLFGYNNIHNRNNGNRYYWI